MHYISTRGETAPLTFSEAMLAGLARDGGLYVPQTYPALTREAIAGFGGRPYPHVAQAVIAPYLGGEIEPHALAAMAEAAYATFDHQAVTPLVQLGDNLFFLELFHGSTLAFKDVAMQLLARLMDHALAERAQRLTIVGATSGDTGAAAIEAFKGRDNIDVFILYPHNRVSDVQRRQMTTAPEDNIHVIALEGTFDDAQAILKALFNDKVFRDDVGLTGVNSINWARVLAQIVYYFTSAVALGSPYRPVSFAVPTGNFGDVLAGYIAKRMGLPVERLIVATNENDILTRTLATGRYEVRGVTPTQSPSMDIQVSSNFERLLFEAAHRDAGAVRSYMARLKQSGAFDLSGGDLNAIRADFDAFAADEKTTRDEIARTYRETGYVIDPHSAVGVSAARNALAKDARTPMIALGTAHPAKFPDAVMQATGIKPALPARLAAIMQGRERFDVLANDQAAIADYIRARARAARQPA
ncbi:MAG: threonine synthase [Methylobacteriaceae bacterium]|nr:threonine synthase [Methylobacteriaceae bacterium]